MKIYTAQVYIGRNNWAPIGIRCSHTEIALRDVEVHRFKASKGWVIKPSRCPEGHAYSLRVEERAADARRTAGFVAELSPIAVTDDMVAS